MTAIMYTSLSVPLSHLSKSDEDIEDVGVIVKYGTSLHIRIKLCLGLKKW